jgi:acetyl esterase/lipase
MSTPDTAAIAKPPAVASDASHRFDPFNIYTTSYKEVNNHKIAVSILIPKTLSPSPSPSSSNQNPTPNQKEKKQPQKKKHPLFVKFHGGGFVQGTALHGPWFTSWLVPFLLRAHAITILPNYRLIPEANGHDVLSDLSDFWAWFDAELEAYVKAIAPGIELDFGRLLVGGDSAGGLLAFQSGVRLPRGKVRALLAQYPMSDYLRREYAPVCADGSPMPGPEIVDEHVRGIKPGTVISSVTPPDRKRMHLSLALATYGRWKEFFGEEAELYPVRAVEGVSHFPPTWIYHGEEDRAVDVRDSRRFVGKLVEVLGEGFRESVRLDVLEGEDHGFDCLREVREEEEAWLREGLRWVEERWLG